MTNTFTYSNTELHLFYNPYSNCSQRVQLLLAEKDLTPSFHEVDLLKGRQLSDEYRKINPNCDVPALVHNGKPMHDSITIMRYLEQNFPSPSFTPSNQREANEMERLLTLASESHMNSVVPFIYATGLGRLPTPSQNRYYDQYLPVRSQFHAERIAGRVANDASAARQTLNEQMKMLDQLLSNSTWLTGETYSLADMAWFSNINVLRILGYREPNYPHLRQWIKRIEMRPTFRKGIKSHYKPIPNWLIRCLLRLIRKLGNRK